MEVHYFAAAAYVRGYEKETVEGLSTINDLVAWIQRQPGLLATERGKTMVEILRRSSFLVDGRRTRDPHESLIGVKRVDILPPFAGG